MLLCGRNSKALNPYCISNMQYFWINIYFLTIHNSNKTLQVLSYCTKYPKLMPYGLNPLIITLQSSAYAEGETDTGIDYVMLCAKHKVYKGSWRGTRLSPIYLVFTPWTTLPHSLSTSIISLSKCRILESPHYRSLGYSDITAVSRFPAHIHKGGLKRARFPLHVPAHLEIYLDLRSMILSLICFLICP